MKTIKNRLFGKTFGGLIKRAEKIGLQVYVVDRNGEKYSVRPEVRYIKVPIVRLVSLNRENRDIVMWATNLSYRKLINMLGGE